jgi:hypothetical protein
MSTQIQRRRGTTAEHSTFTGVEGELTVDTTKDTAVVHDGTTVGGHPLQKQYPPLGSAAAPTYTFTGDLNTGIYSPGADQVAVSTGGALRITVDASGRLLVGTSSARSNFFNTASSAPQQLQVEGTTGNTCSLSSICSVADTSGGRLLLAHQRSGAVGGNTILNSGDQAGYITFQGNDGGEFVECASIEAQVDGTPGANDMPGRLVFSTTADGGSSPSERLRITSAGLVGIGTSVPVSGAQLTVAGSALAVTGQNIDHSANSIRIGEEGSGAAQIRCYGPNTSTNGSLTFKMSRSDGSNSQDVVIDGSGRLGVGTTSPSSLFHLSGNGGTAVFTLSDPANGMTGKLAADPTTLSLGTTTNHAVLCYTNSAERARIDTSGRLLVGTSSAINSNYSGTGALLQVAKNGYLPIGFYAYSDIAGESGYCPYVELHRATGTQASPTVVGSGDDLGLINFYGHDGSTFMRSALIKAVVDGTPGAGDMPGRLVFSTTADGASSPTERMRINAGGNFLINQTTTDDPAGTNTQGLAFGSAGWISNCRDGATPVLIGRKGADGTLVEFFQDGTVEGSISVSGTTVSYNGAHLSRWSQLPNGAEREEILRGTVLSNIDEMCGWGEEENEQLNRMKVSDVEGDKNVSGVFQAWDDDDDTYINDFYCAMTGDFIIRIAEGITVERGDLLMSAGDGTAKPQDDDIIRSKTIAKVTSTNVSCTYEDGSYCVPCVLMAC